MTDLRKRLAPEALSRSWRDPADTSRLEGTAAARNGTPRIFRPIPIWRTPLEVALSAPGSLAERCLHLLIADGLPIGQVFIEPGQSLATKVSKVESVLRHVERDYAASRSRPMLEVSGAATASVIVCTAGKSTELEQCLRSLAKQDRTPDEVLVVDYGSGSRSVQTLAEAFGASYFREFHPMLDYARNTGAQHATGDIVAYVDHETRLDSQWLGRIVKAFDEPEIEAVTGLVLPDEIETQTQWLFESSRSSGRVFRRRDFQPGDYERQKRWAFPSWSIGHGCNMAFRRSVFDRIGGFDIRLGAGAAGGSGAAEYWNRILHFGGHCRYEPSVVVYKAPPRDDQTLASYIRDRASGHVAGLLVQHERTQERGNLRRVFRTLPIRLIRQWIDTAHQPQARLKARAQLKGYLAGVLFYVRTSRPKNVPKARPASPFSFDPSRYGIEAPLISVVVPAYNAQRTLDRTLLSIRSQTYEKLEIIVVDDGSTDATSDIAAAHAASDPRILVVRKPNAGLAAARNTGIHHATGAYIAPVDADDLCHPEKYARLLKALLQAGPICAMAYGDSAVIDETDRVVSVPQPRSRRLEGHVFRELLQSNFIGNGSSPLIRRAALLEAGLYDPGLRAAGADGSEDLKLYLAIAERYEFACVPMPLTGYRLSSGSMSASISPVIRSHRMVVEPYAQRYPEHAQEIERGHFNLVLWYVLRSLKAGKFRQAAVEFEPLLRQAPWRASKALLKTVLSQKRRWSWPRALGTAQEEGPAKTFPYGEGVVPARSSPHMSLGSSSHL